MQIHMERIQINNYIKDNKLKIIVKPSSSENKILKYDDSKQALRIAVKAQPEKGKANKELINFLSKLLKKKVKIIHGFTSKEKLLHIS